MITRGDKMKISIIVPIYKVEKYIRQCVDSIISQTYKSLEIILVDDGSPDNCTSICDEYALKDSRIIVIHQDNKGLIEARKSGLRAATGEYVCFVDGDDWIEPDMYDNIRSAVEKYGPDCVITQFYYSYPDKEDKSNYHLYKEYYSRREMEKEVFPTMLFCEPYYSFGIYPNCWTKVFKKEILEKHLYGVDSRIRMGEDIAFTFPCLMECQSIAFIDKPFYHYRINPESMTKSYDERLYDRIFLPYEILKSSNTAISLAQQLPYYLLYLINFFLRNELNAKNADNSNRNLKLKAIVDNSEMQNRLKTVDKKILPLHTRILLRAILKKDMVLLNAYCNVLKWFI